MEEKIIANDVTKSQVFLARKPLESLSTLDRKQNIVLVTPAENSLFLKEVRGGANIEDPKIFANYTQSETVTLNRLKLVTPKEVVANAMRIIKEAKGRISLAASSSPQTSGDNLNSLRGKLGVGRN